MFYETKFIMDFNRKAEIFHIFMKPYSPVNSNSDVSTTFTNKTESLSTICCKSDDITVVPIVYLGIPVHISICIRKCN